jgi:hypothetical protein
MEDTTPPDNTNQQLSPLLDAEPIIDKPKPRGLRALWSHTWLHWLVLLLLLAGVGTAAGLPISRYWVLNHMGVRSTASVIVIDDVTHQPLQHVQVSLAGITTETGSDGRAVLHDLQLGPSRLTIAQAGFSEISRQVTVGWGSNPFDRMQLKAIGVQYTVLVVDALSGKPVANAQVESATTAARGNDKGLAILTLPNNEATDEITVSVARDGYRTEQATVKASTKIPVPIPLMTSRKAVYVSKQSGTYDVYTSDADGRNTQVILPGTGNEGPNISLAVSADGTRAAVVSTRDKQYSADGYLLSTLTLINVDDGTSTVLTHADQIQLVDWIGSRLIFQQGVASGVNRYSIISYDYAANTRFQLTAAARFSSVLSAQGTIYYAIASVASDPSVQPYLYRVDPDGGNKQTVLEKEVWSAYRTGYDTFSVQTSDGWYTHTVSTKINKIASAPEVLTSKLFIEQANDSGRSLWLDTRGGTGTLQVHAKTENKDTAIVARAGLVYPIRWLTDDSAIYRVVTNGETADYVVGTTPGRPAHKIADVVNTYGFSTGQ